MSIEAMKQAIEAINEAVAFREGGRQKAIDAINALRTAIQQAESEPVLFVSPEQARAVTGKNRVHYTPSDNSGRYLPVRATPAGLFVQPLYTHPAPGVPDDVVRDAKRWQEVLRHVGADRQMGLYRFTLYDLRPIRGVNPMKGAVCQHFTKAIDAAMLAASPAQKGGE